MTAAHGGPAAATGLRGLLQRPRPQEAAPLAAAPEERCDLCAEPLPPVHRHMADVAGGSGAGESASREAVLCACRACSLLFDPKPAGGGHYRLLPRRRTRVTGLHIDDPLWAGLGIPVDLAFFVRESATGEVAVRYPSPLGAVRSAVTPREWAEVTRGHADLAGVEDDVEALLVHRRKGAPEHWIVPLDDCYRLVAVVRGHWRGLSGGDEVWERVAAFFTGLSETSGET